MAATSTVLHGVRQHHFDGYADDIISMRESDSIDCYMVAAVDGAQANHHSHERHWYD